ncbi:F0F1 ATP synthase subunit B [Ignatzschineria sp. RMDPL8A]|uniref:F0F1 ATP synthase subunit B n=1 Tax=Ignatzschineria sp. RMDPL8A TaxID=2999236 RepID=UPI002446693C|nr:F0F1 ATP synthase subunit B [Ignatzschineria sp. RMDPL8A]MDG9728920.1 F0F1 ATP synthase subunit B [Ignatzschineria sp. RMDPL8A]
MNLSSTLFAQFAVFFTLVWVVMKFIWPPLIKALDERRAKIADGLKAAEDSVEAKARAESDAQVVMQEARLEASNLVGKAQSSAESLVAKSKEDARLAGERELDAARNKIDAELGQIKEKLREEVVALSILGASKIVEKEVDKNTHAKLLEDLANQL